MILLGLFTFSILASLVVAATPTLSESLTKFINGVKAFFGPIFKALLGETTDEGNFTAKILVFLLAVVVIAAVLNMVPGFADRMGINIIVSVIVSILGVRFLPADIFGALALPSSSLVASLTIGLPFIIYFFLLQRIGSPMVRRAGWVLFAAVTISLWWINRTKPFYIIYVFILIGCIIAFWFDGVLHRFLGSARRERRVAGITRSQENRIITEIKDAQKALATATTPADRTAIKAEIESLKAALKTLS